MVSKAPASSDALLGCQVISASPLLDQEQGWCLLAKLKAMPLRGLIGGCLGNVQGGTQVVFPRQTRGARGRAAGPVLRSSGLPLRITLLSPGLPEGSSGNLPNLFQWASVPP